jgi:hypothetical protein
MSLNSGDSGLPFALMRWIKAQQEKERKHQEVMALRNAKDDQHFIGFIRLVAPRWTELKTYERTLISNLVQWKEDGRNFTPQQKSAISGMYLRHVIDRPTETENKVPRD